MTAPCRGDTSAVCADGPTPGQVTSQMEVTSDRHNRKVDAGAADGHAAGPPGGQGPGRRAWRLHPPGPAAPHQPRHRRGRYSARPLRAHPGARLPRLRRTSQDRCARRSAGKAGTSRTNPASPRTRPPTTRSGGSRSEPKRNSSATRPPRPGRTRPTLTSSSPSWTRRSPNLVCAGRPPRPSPRGGTARPAAARTLRTCPGVKSTLVRWARATPRRTARPSARRCSSP